MREQPDLAWVPDTEGGRPDVSADALNRVARAVGELCARQAGKLPFHGWHHVSFVRAKAEEFALRNGANPTVVATAALVHDVNYVVRRNSPAAEGRDLRLDILLDCGIAPATAEWIDAIVREAEMATRGRDISLEAQALSDADTLFKALPVTPVILAHRYLDENGLSLRELASKIVGEQRDVHEQGYYFYSEQATAMYARWASANLELWQCVMEALDEPSVSELLDSVGD